MMIIIGTGTSFGSNVSNSEPKGHNDKMVQVDNKKVDHKGGEMNRDYQMGGKMDNHKKDEPKKKVEPKHHNNTSDVTTGIVVGTIIGTVISTLVK